MNAPAKLLLSNDDGYQARGLATLARALAPLYEITVVAPERNCSGASNSLSLHNALRVRYVAHLNGWHEHNIKGFYCAHGTPADCVHFAITGMLATRMNWHPDMVIAGINHGGNLGDDVLYSGTVAAAIEGRFLGLPALAVSMVGERMNHPQTAAEVVVRALNHLRAKPLPQDTILNINVPDLPFDQLTGIRATRLGARHQSQPIIEEPAAGESRAGDADTNQRVYRIGPIGEGADVGPGTDFHAVDAGAVSVTPLQIDMTRHHSLENIAHWLRDMAL